MIGDKLLKSQEVLFPTLVKGTLLKVGNAFQPSQLVFTKLPVFCCHALGADPHRESSLFFADRVSLQPVVLARPSPFPREEHLKVGQCA